MYNLKQMLSKNLGLGMEDNAQVEVNFNIDTDEDGAPTDDDVDVTGELDTGVDEEQQAEQDESENESDLAEEDMDQLQEAQDSLESLGVVLDKHYSASSMSRMGIGFYKVALESLVGSKTLEDVAVPSFESREYSKRHSTILSLESHAQLVEHVERISLESETNWLKKLRHQVAVFFKGEKALLKRAQGLHSIAQTSKNEKAANEQIEVNDNKGLKLPILLSKKWSSEEQFLQYVQEFTGLYNSMAEVGTKYSDEFVDNIFPGSDKWKESDKGGKTYETFGIKLVRNELVEGFTAQPVTQVNKVVNLTPAMCEKVLVEIMNTLRKGNMVSDNISTMCDVCERVKKVNMSTSDTLSTTGNTREEVVTGKSSTVHTSETYPEGYLEMMKTLEDLMVIKNKVMTEILNYVNYSLTDREFN